MLRILSLTISAKLVLSFGTNVDIFQTLIISSWIMSFVSCAWGFSFGIGIFVNRNPECWFSVFKLKFGLEDVLVTFEKDEFVCS